MTVILTGTNDFARSQALKRLVADFISAESDIALERLDGETITYDRLHEAVMSLPFLASKKMVLVQDLAANKAVTERISDLLGTVPDTTDLIIAERKLDKRGVYYKLLKSQKGFIEYGELDDYKLADWLVARAKEQGGAISSSDARYMIERIGSNQQLLGNTLDMLQLYQATVRREAIDLMTEPNPRSTVFELLEAAFSGNARRTMTLYEEQRRLRVEPQAMLGLMAWQLHILALVKAAGKKSSAEIASEAGVSPYVVSKTVPIAARLTMEEIKQLVHHALALDIRLKTESIDSDSAMQHLLLSIAT